MSAFAARASTRVRRGHTFANKQLAAPEQRLIGDWSHVDAFWTCVAQTSAAAAIISGATTGGIRRWSAYKSTQSFCCVKAGVRSDMSAASCVGER